MPMPRSFKARRVTEALFSIAGYVDQAMKLADGIELPAADEAKLKSTRRVSRPTPERVEPPFIEWNQRTDKFKLEFRGQHLSRVERVALIPTTNLNDDDFVTRNVSCTTDKSFKAEVDLEDAQAGVYHVWLRDHNGLEGFLRNAFTIQPEPKKTTAPPPYGTSSPPYVAVEPPCIVGEPKDCTVAEGDNASFVAQATGTAPLTYQWQKDGCDLDKACGETLDLSNVNQASAGKYQVKVINSAGSVMSNPVTLTVNPCPTTPPATGKKAPVKKAEK
jgi:hypothetical protein